MRTRFDPSRIALAVAAPVLALLVSLLISTIALAASGNSPTEAFSSMYDYGTTSASLWNAVNRATPYFLSGCAVAIGFRMGLFNIGVEGQYRLAVLMAAFVGGAVSLPAPLHVGLIIVVAMVTGSAWAAIPAVLKVTRGVSEVISTIMLNAAATGISAYLLFTYFKQDVAGSNNVTTKTISTSGRLPDLDGLLRGIGLPVPSNAKVYGFVVIAILLGIGLQVLITRTRFGFELRASGLNATAATAAGVNAKAMVMKTMLISGAIAGLVGLPQLLGSSYRYALDFPAGIGFTGIAVALLGRNNPFGIALGAYLFGWLERASQTLEFKDIPPEIYVIMQGSIVLSVVVAYEAVRRFGVAAQGRAVARAAARLTDDSSGRPTAATTGGGRA